MERVCRRYGASISRLLIRALHPDKRLDVDHVAGGVDRADLDEQRRRTPVGWHTRTKTALTHTESRIRSSPPPPCEVRDTEIGEAKTASVARNILLETAKLHRPSAEFAVGRVGRRVGRTPTWPRAPIGLLYCCDGHAFKSAFNGRRRPGPCASESIHCKPKELMRRSGPQRLR